MSIGPRDTDIELEYPAHRRVRRGQRWLRFPLDVPAGLSSGDERLSLVDDGSRVEPSGWRARSEFSDVDAAWFVHADGDGTGRGDATPARRGREADEETTTEEVPVRALRRRVQQ